MTRIAPDIAARVRVGIAGWSYADWDGYVYPPGVKDKLRYVAPYVDVLEINSTFYRNPAPRTAASWVRRTADLPHLAFTAKLNRRITHEQRLTPAIADETRRALAPLREAGKLRHLLAQFRYDFDDTAEHRALLERIAEHFRALTAVTLELRHRSWQDQGALSFLDALGINLATLDYPEAADSFSLDTSPVGRHAYMRLHGRNRRAWFSSGAGRDETYNYLYKEPEIDGILERIARQAAMSKTLTLVANNHYQGQEMVNALEIKARLHGGKLDLPPGLAEQYPRLRTIAKPAGRPASRWRQQELL